MKKLNEVSKLVDITYKNAKLLKAHSGQPCNNDFKYYLKNAEKPQHDNYIINGSSFQDVMEDLSIITNIGLENYDGGITASYRMLSIIQSKKNANKTAQCMQLVCFVGYGATHQQVTKYYKSLNNNEKKLLDKLISDYLIHEYNHLVECYNYDNEV